LVEGFSFVQMDAITFLDWWSIQNLGITLSFCTLIHHFKKMISFFMDYSLRMLCNANFEEFTNCRSD